MDWPHYLNKIKKNLQLPKKFHIAGEVAWVGFGILANVLAMLIGTRFLTSLLSTSEYGALALAISLANLANHIFGIPIGQTGLRFYQSYIDADKSSVLLSFMGKSLLWAFSLVVAVGFIVVFNSGNFENYPGDSFVFLTVGFAILLVVNRSALGVEDASRKRSLRAISQGIFEISRFLIAVILILLLSNPSAVITMLGFVLGGLLTATVHLVFFKGLFSKSPVKAINTHETQSIGSREAMRRFQLPLVVSSVCLWVVMMTERWALQKFGTLSNVGGYAAVYQLSFVPMVVLSNFFLVLTEPVLYQIVGPGKSDDSKGRAFLVNRHLTTIIILFSITLSLICFFAHPIISRLFLGEAFRAYSWLFPWLVLAGGCYAAGHQLLLNLSCEMQTGKLAVLWFIVSIVAVVCYFTATYFWQVKGLLVAVIFVFTLLLILAIQQSPRGEKIPGK